VSTEKAWLRSRRVAWSPRVKVVGGKGVAVSVFEVHGSLTTIVVPVPIMKSKGAVMTFNMLPVLNTAVIEYEPSISVFVIP
jgi:hypothetical protein